MAGNLNAQYDIYDTGCDKNLVRGAMSDNEIPNLNDQDPVSSIGSNGGSDSFNGGLNNTVDQVTVPGSIISGELTSVLFTGKKTFTDTTAGYRMGIDTDNTYKWIIGGPSSSIDWNVTTPDTLTVIGSINVTAGGTVGGFQVGSDYIRDVANSFGLASTVTGGNDVRIWAGDTFANRATAPFRVYEDGSIVATGLTVDHLDIPDTITANSFHVDTSGNAWWGATTLVGSSAKVLNTGAASFNSMTITGGSIGGTTTVGVGNVNIASRGWTQTSVFSITDADTVAWGAGTFTSADGTAYAIGAGNTGNMTLATYIYLDIVISTIAYQTTTTASTAVGAGKVLIAKAQNGTGEATFQVFGGIGGTNINASSIVANSITANELSTSITYAGSIIIDTAGNIRSGQTAFNVGTGWFIGNDGAVPKLSIGDTTTQNSVTWDGTTLLVNGSTIANQFIYGDGSDGDATISGNTTLTSDMYYDDLTIATGITLDPGGYRIFVNGILTFQGTGKIARTPNAGSAGSDGLNSTGGVGGGGGAALTAGSLPAGEDGKTGGTGGDGSALACDAGDNGTAGDASAKALAGAGSAGGDGGAGSGGCGTFGTGGAAGSATGTVFNKIRNAFSAFNLIDINPSVVAFTIAGGSGAGGGGSSGRILGVDYSSGGGGGGSGSTGGFVWVSARKIVTVNGNNYIEVKGGDGGMGGSSGIAQVPANGYLAGAGGGGGGGRGGVVVLLYGSKTGTGTISVAGGIGGVTGTNGNAGSSGPNGGTGLAVTLQI